MDKIPSYPKVYNVGHAAIRDLFKQAVLVQEKVDGSQFSFMLTRDGEVLLRSRGAAVDPDNPGMFDKAVETVLERRAGLTPGWIYRGEYLRQPKHNTLAYERTPAGYIVLFDIGEVGEYYMPHELVRAEALRLGLEPVRTFEQRTVNNLEEMKAYLQEESALGGQKVEGVVFKSYHQYTRDGKAMMGKYVSEEFKERHQKSWPKSGTKNVLGRLILALCTEARWEKAVQHLAERGELEGTPRDIGKLIVEVREDTLAEEEAAIKDSLFASFKRDIVKGVTRGVAEWYKERLAQEAFDGDHSTRGVV
jgi:hypothetical protein